MTDKAQVSFKCGNCGTKIVWSDDAIDSTEIFCANCGERAGTYGDLRDAAMEAAKAKVESILKDAFKNR